MDDTAAPQTQLMLGVQEMDYTAVARIDYS